MLRTAVLLSFLRRSLRRRLTLLARGSTSGHPEALAPAACYAAAGPSPATSQQTAACQHAPTRG